MTWAQNISAAFTQGGVNAFLWWWGASASTANSGLIQVLGPTINLSARYWASAAFGRFIRPGAVRIGAQAAAPGVQVSAFADPDGRLVIEAINTAAAAQQVRLQGPGGWQHAAAYLTDGGHDLARVAPPAADGITQLPARSLTTWVLPAG
jgi:glucosylceramidase